MNENNNALLKDKKIWIMVAAIVLCITTVFTFTNNNTFKITYKGETTTYKIDEMHWNYVPEENLKDEEGNPYTIDAYYYINVDYELLKKLTIWNFTSITYVKKDGSIVKYDSDEYYVKAPSGVGGELIMEDSLRREKDDSLTLIHRTYEREKDSIHTKQDKEIEINDVVEIIVGSPVYK